METTESALPMSDPAPELVDNRFGEHADLIDIRQEETGCRLTIDGEDFPYFTAPGLVIPPVHGELPRLTFTLMADHVQIDNQWNPGAPSVAEPWKIPGSAGWPAKLILPAGWAQRIRAKRADTMIGRYAFANLIQLRRYYDGWQMVIDGEIFPYLMAPEACSQVVIDNVPGVEITLLAKRITADIARMGSAPADLDE